MRKKKHASAQKARHFLMKNIRPITQRENAFNKTLLRNGLRILSERVPYANSVAIGVWINAGSRYELPKENGLSHLVEHAVFKGTTRRKTHQIAQYLEAVGGYLNAMTTKENTCYYARVLPEHLERAVDLLSDLVLHPTFPEKEIEKEKQVIIEEMHAIEDEPEDMVHEYFEKLIFSPHPLGQPIIGTEENINAASAASLRRFTKKFHTTGNMVIAAAGNVHHDALTHCIEKYFSENERGAVTSSVEKLSRKKSRAEIFHKPTQQIHVCFGKPTPPIKTTSRYAMALVNIILGDGMSSRLFQAIRERYGLAYSVYSFLSFMREAGVFGVYFGADEANLDRCISVTKEQLYALRIGSITTRELHRAKEQMKGGILFSLESVSDRMSHIARNELYFEKYFSTESILQDIDAVTLDEVHEVASSLCDVESYFMTTVLPEKT